MYLVFFHVIFQHDFGQELSQNLSLLHSWIGTLNTIPHCSHVLLLYLPAGQPSDKHDAYFVLQLCFQRTKYGDAGASIGKPLLSNLSNRSTNL